MMRAGGLALLGLVAAAGSGCASTDADWRERYLEKERDASELSGQLSEERGARSASVAQLEEARSQLAGLRRENDGYRARPGDSAVLAPAPVNDAAVNGTVERLKKDGMDAHVTADGNIAITLPADINFGAGSKELTPAGKKALDQVAKELDVSFSGYSARIEGHTDSDPIKKSNFKDNWELGSERALAVLRYLSSVGVSGERLISSSRGDTMPVADNKSDKGKAKNRRVEVIVLVPRDAPMAK